MDHLVLKQKSEEILAQEPKLRIRNVADRLGVSERDLVQAQCCGVESQFLGTDYKAIFKRLGELGEVMALSRNDWCVHERHGKYEKISAGDGHVGLVLGPDIDLRLFFTYWDTVWSVKQGDSHSIQFFDKAGGAIHKVYKTSATDVQAFEALIEAFVSQEPVPETSEIPQKTDYAQSAPSSLRDDWLAMKDTHDFFPLLRKWNVPRVTALKAAGTDLAQEVSTDTAEKMLIQASEKALPIMCFVGNQNIVQIHAGPVEKVMRYGPWYNVLDPKFNLHLNTEAINSAWVVNKPTDDGYVTSLELYAKGGQIIAQFFGVRKPGNPELNEWRQLLRSFCTSPLLGDA